jgi:phosphotriesterase-related protein
MPVITVNGIVNWIELGLTLPHEHLFMDLSFVCETSEEAGKKKYFNEKISLNNLHLLKYDQGALKDNLILDDEETAVVEVSKFRTAGGKTIVEQSSIGAGRSPQSLKNISKRTGINIVMGGGYYLKQSLPDEILRTGESELIIKMVNEIRFGADGTGIRPGMIGELGIGPKIEAWDKKLLKAAAKTQTETGLPISIHIQAVPVLSGFSGRLNGIDVLNILEKSGADINKTVICHTDARIDLEYIRNIIDFGAYAEFDHFGKDFYYPQTGFLMDRDIDRLAALKELIDLGLTRKVLISHDVCLKTDLTAYGGQGYAHLLNGIVPMMIKNGIAGEDINTIMVENPKKLLDIEEKYL